MSKKPTAKDLQDQINELTQALQRERADSDNIRRHHEQQITSLKALAKANIVRDLLPVIDNLERALKHVPKDLEGSEYVKGVQGVVKQFEATLKQLEVERIKTVGEIFDPRLHEAVGVEESDGTVERICEELQAGYRIGDDIIRHAMVKVKMEKK